MVDIRTLLKSRAEELGFSLKDLSLSLGKNHSYLQQFITKGSPRTLPLELAAKLAPLLQLDASVLLPEGLDRATREYLADNILPFDRQRNEALTVPVPEFDVHLSAGGGQLVEAENVKREWPFPIDYLRHVIGINHEDAAIAEVRGDSMAPTLNAGDMVMVNMRDKDPTQPGVFVIFDGDGTVIKRLEKVPLSEPVELVLISDNQLHSKYTVPAEQVMIVGRVCWRSHRM